MLSNATHARFGNADVHISSIYTSHIYAEKQRREQPEWHRGLQKKSYQLVHKQRRAENGEKGSSDGLYYTVDFIVRKKKKQQHIHTKTYNRKFCFKQNKSLWVLVRPCIVWFKDIQWTGQMHYNPLIENKTDKEVLEK